MNYRNFYISKRKFDNRILYKSYVKKWLFTLYRRTDIVASYNFLDNDDLYKYDYYNDYVQEEKEDEASYILSTLQEEITWNRHRAEIKWFPSCDSRCTPWWEWEEYDENKCANLKREKLFKKQQKEIVRFKKQRTKHWDF